MTDHRRVQFELVAEVVVDSGGVHAGAIGDLLDSRRVQATLGKHLAGSFNQLAAGLLRGDVVFHIGHGSPRGQCCLLYLSLLNNQNRI